MNKTTGLEVLVEREYKKVEAEVKKKLAAHKGC